MHDYIAVILGKYKHIIVIGIALVALGSYLVPLNFVFAGHNNGNTAAGANQAARDSIKKVPSSSSSTSTPVSSPSSSKSNTPSSTTTKAGTNSDPGHLNTGTGDTGNRNSGNNDIGNRNSGNNDIGNQNIGNNDKGNRNVFDNAIGNNCGGSGHYSCIVNGVHIRQG